MAVTYEMLIKDQNVRNEFMNFDSNRRSMVFSKLQSPEGFTPNQTKILQHKIENMSMPWKNVPWSAIKHIPSNSIEAGRNIFNMIKHPIKSIDAIQDLALGGAMKLIDPPFVPKTKVEKQFDATTRFFIDRYKGNETDMLAGLKRTMATKPIDFLNDLSTVLTGSGALLKAGTVTKATKAMEASEKASRLSSIHNVAKPSLVNRGVEYTKELATDRGRIATGIKTAGIYTDPIAGPINAASNTITKYAPDFVKKRVQKAFKFEKHARHNEDTGLSTIDAYGAEATNRKLWQSRGERLRLGKAINKDKNFINHHLSQADMKGERLYRSGIIDSMNSLKKEIESSAVDMNTKAAELEFIEQFQKTIRNGKRTVDNTIVRNVETATYMKGNNIGKNELLAQVDNVIYINEVKIQRLIKLGKPSKSAIEKNKILHGMRVEISNTKGKMTRTGHGLKQSREVLSSEQIHNIKEEIFNTHATVTLTQANNLKKQLNKTYIPALQTSVDISMKLTKDKIRKHVMDEIADKHPIVGQVNSHMRESIYFQESISKRIRELSTMDSHLLQNMIAGGVGATAGGVLYKFTEAGAATSIAAGILISGVMIPVAVVMKFIFSDPNVKLATAKLIHKGLLQTEKAKYIASMSNPMYQMARVVHEGRKTNDVIDEQLNNEQELQENAKSLQKEIPTELNTIRSSVESALDKMKKSQEVAIVMQEKAKQIISIMNPHESRLIIQSISQVVNSNVSKSQKLSQINKFLSGNIGHINPTEIDAFNVFAASAIKNYNDKITKRKIIISEYINKLSNARLNSDYLTYERLIKEAKGITGINITNNNVKKAINKKQNVLRSQGMSNEYKSQSSGSLSISIN